MKTLYVSDLDGTLFNKNKNLSANTITLLNKCLTKDIYFAVATARMPYSCDHRLEALNLTTPSVLTNGVFLYDFSKRCYIKEKKMSADVVKEVISVFNKMDTGVFLYCFDQNQIQIFYSRKDMTSQTQYYSDRALECCESVIYQDELESIIDHENVVYLACTDEKEKLEPIYNTIQFIPGVSCAYYLNIYNGLYCIEIFSESATKKNTLLDLKNLLQCDEVVVFGDNLNDLSMFEIADRKYAVENALEPVKEVADKIIPSCDHDGVAKFIYNEMFN